MSLQADLKTTLEEIHAKRIAMKALYAGIADLSGAKAAERTAEFRQANDELAVLAEKRDNLQTLVDIETENTEAMKAAQMAGRPEPLVDRLDKGERGDADYDVENIGAKSVRELLKGNPAIKSGFRGELGQLSQNAIKTLLQSSAMTPLEDRQTRILPYLTESRFTVADLVLQGTTNAQKITYFEETTFTNAADFVGEGLEKPEGALAWTLREANVRKIAVWIPVTDEALDDLPSFESIIRNRLAFMVRQKEEAALLSATASSTSIGGILTTSGVQTVTGYGMSTIDSILAAITEVEVDGYAEANALVIHPRDWFDIRTSKSVTGGDYLLGPPTAVGPQSVWGLTVRRTRNIPENTALVGDFTQAQIFRKGGLDVAISTEHDDFFIKNKLAVRAEERIAFAVYRPAAFCKVEALVQGS